VKDLADYRDPKKYADQRAARPEIRDHPEDGNNFQKSRKTVGY